MKKICFYSDDFKNNECFDLSNKKNNRDNFLFFLYMLKIRLSEIRIELSTQDLCLVDGCSFFIYNEMPKEVNVVDYNYSYLIIWESEVINRKNWNKEAHNKFKKIFTWNDELVDNIKYFKINFCHKFPSDKAIYSKSLKSFNEKKLCSVIAGNKRVKHELELYSERVKVIRWFERHAISDLDLYGIGWDKNTSDSKYARFILSNIPFLNKYVGSSFRSYKGPVNSKAETLSNYKFSICFENAQMIPGYITEKIFDCFFAGCIPIYWGASNINEHIPENCFIDYRQFDSIDEMYFFIKNMPEEQYQLYLREIESFLFSEKSNQFKAEYFVQTIVGHLVNDIKD